MIEHDGMWIASDEICRVSLNGIVFSVAVGQSQSNPGDRGVCETRDMENPKILVALSEMPGDMMASFVHECLHGFFGDDIAEDVCERLGVDLAEAMRQWRYAIDRVPEIRRPDNDERSVQMGS